MADFEVLNVGQGDSILLNPSSGCRYGGKTVFIDLGPGRYDITENINRNDRVHIFLTHHDNDHLGGMHFFAGKIDQIEEIIVPLYQNEITLIARAILNLKGIREAEECGEFVKEALALNDVRIYGDPDTMVEKAAICTGSGKSMISDVLAKGADVYVTGDIDHHTGIDAVASGLPIIDAGHYGTEYIFMKAMRKILEEKYPSLQITCAKVKSPYMIL